MNHTVKDSTPVPARVLVASDQATDADLAARLLQEDFTEIRTSYLADKAVAEFESFSPDVLVMAFDAVDKCDRYYLSLYRKGQLVHSHPHRTIVLCSKDDVRRVFRLCREEFFDDYVLFWPAPYDGHRLNMSVLRAVRELRGFQRQNVPNNLLMQQVGHLQSFTEQLSGQLRQGQMNIQSVHKSLTQSSQQVRQVMEKVIANGLASPESIQGLRNFTENELQPTVENALSAVSPLVAWVKSLEDQAETQKARQMPLVSQVQALRPRILVVDDDPFSLELAAKALEKLGCDAHPVKSAFEAMQRLQRDRFDMVVLDYMMPGTNGIEATRQLRKIPNVSSIPVLMMTSESRRDVIVESRQAGVNDFVLKPLQMSTLASKLTLHLGRIQEHP